VYQSAFFALRDTRTTARIAALRVLFAAIAGAALMLQFEPIHWGSLHISAGLFGDMQSGGRPLGPIGLAAGATLGAWFEWTLLRRRLSARVGSVGPGTGHVVRMFAAALVAGAIGYGIGAATQPLHPLPRALVVGAGYGAAYLLVARLLGLSEAVALWRTLARRFTRRAR